MVERVLDEVIETPLDEYQHRLVCLKLAHVAQELAGDLDTDKVIARADRYWEFILGVPDDDSVLKTIKEAGTA